MDNPLLVEFKDSTSRIIAGLNNCDPTLFLLRPGEGKWNISDITEHLNITDKSAYLAMLKSAPAPTPEELEEKEKRFNYLATGDNIQLVAPPTAEPKGKFGSQEEAIAAFSKSREKLLQFFTDNELDSLASGFEHPRLGFLTRRQWMRFLSWHANHHAKQIDKILAQPIQ